MQRSLFMLLLIISLLATPGFAQTERQIALRSNLLLYQTFNFPFGDRIDTPGFPNVVHGQAQVTTGMVGRYGEALLLPDTESGVGYVADGNFPPSRDFIEGTLALWVYFCTPPKDFARSAILFEAPSGNDETPFRLAIVPGSPPLLVFEAGSIEPSDEQIESSTREREKFLVSCPFDLEAKKWRHVAAVWKNLTRELGEAELLLYLDGRRAVRKTQAAHTFHWKNKGQMIRLGSGFIGMLDDVALFGSALSSREITRLYRHPEGVGGIYLPARQ